MSEATADAQARSEPREPEVPAGTAAPAAADADSSAAPVSDDSSVKRAADEDVAHDSKRPKLEDHSSPLNGGGGTDDEDAMRDDGDDASASTSLKRDPHAPQSAANGHASANDTGANGSGARDSATDSSAGSTVASSVDPNASGDSSHADSGQAPAPESSTAEHAAERDGTPGPESAVTPLERATQAADRARIAMLPDLDPAEPPAKGTGLPKHQHKYALSAIRAIKRLKYAAPFVAPVDPVKQGVPQYFEYIKHPMDLGTMERQLVGNEYDTVKSLVHDFNLIVSNCIIFNGEDALISKMALSIAQSFKKQLSNMPTYDATRKGAQAAAEEEEHAAAAASASAAAAATAAAAAADEHVGKRSSTATAVIGPNGVPTLRRKSTIDGRPKREIRPPRQPGFAGSGSGEGRPRNKKYAAELRFASQVLKEMQGRKLENIAFPFLLPVDPVEQGVPTYFDVIKEPMDISTMQRKLNDGIYYTGDEFEADVRLMFRNAYTFNPEGTPVNAMAHKLEDWFDQRWLEKPVPGPAPSDDDDANEINEEYAESGIQNSAVDFMEEQLRTVRKQLTRLKKATLAEHYKKGNRRGGVMKKPSHAQRPSQSHVAHQAMPTEMTYEMKRELRDRIDKLPEKKIRTVIAIIQESLPDLGQSGQEEIELEVDSLDQATLLRLYKYAVLGRREEPKTSVASADVVSEAASPGASGASKKRKSKPLSEEEHNRQIAEIERKLNEFDQASGSPGATLGTTGVHAAGSAVGESDDSSDEPHGFGSDDDDSSSEEE